MFKNVLVACDTVQGLEIALDRATQIEHVTEAEVTVADVIWDQFADEPPKIISAETKERLIGRFVASEQKLLDRALEPYQSKIETLDGRVLWAKRVEERIAAEASALSTDLVIKPVTEASHGLQDWFKTPLDWRLMRTLEVPVLFGQSRPWPHDKRIVAAVDVSAKHRDVSREVLACASSFATVLGCGIHVVNVMDALTPHTPESITFGFGRADHQRLVDDLRSTQIEALEKMVADLDLPYELHVLEGHPGPAIEELGREIEATMTIVGTAARRGVGKLLVGNTAEQIITHTSSDLVTVHAPAGATS